jgi:hypothetical protein
MKAMLNATDVRRHWGQFIDDVVREGPRFVKRNRDELAALSTDHLHIVLAPYQFDVQVFKEEDGTVTVSLDSFDLVENGDTYEEAIDLLADELVEYSQEYLENFNVYFHSPNRRNHFPYILHVFIQKDIEGVKSLIRCPAGEK